MTGTNTTTSGNAQRIQSRKVSSVPVLAAYSRMKIRLGGVPMGVPIPPTLAA